MPTHVHRCVYSCVGDYGRRWCVQCWVRFKCAYVFVAFRHEHHSLAVRFVKSFFVGGCFNAAATILVQAKRKIRNPSQQYSQCTYVYICIYITWYFVHTRTNTYLCIFSLYISIRKRVCVLWGCLPLPSILYSVSLPASFQRICSFLQRTLVIERVCTHKFIYFLKRNFNFWVLLYVAALIPHWQFNAIVKKFCVLQADYLWVCGGRWVSMVVYVWVCCM